jgi:hypothetical protein
LVLVLPPRNILFIPVYHRSGALARGFGVFFDIFEKNEKKTVTGRRRTGYGPGAKPV